MPKTHCKHHGTTDAFLTGGRLRCKRCNVEHVTKARRDRKTKLVEWFGGKCEVCGYDRCRQALQFHHLDPSIKKFGIGADGACRSWDESLNEAYKCLLVCANCHTEIENGVLTEGQVAVVVERRPVKPKVVGATPTLASKKR